MHDISIYNAILEDTEIHDRLYFFLKNVFRLYPEDAFFALIKQELSQHSKAITFYNSVQDKLDSISPKLADLRYALPALYKQKRVIADQTKQLFKDSNTLSPLKDYLEIGTKGRHVKDNANNLAIQGHAYVLNDEKPNNSLVDILDRGTWSQRFTYIDLNNYADIQSISEQHLDLISCYVGLHHIKPNRFQLFLDSLFSKLKSGGYFILRDHDCKTDNDVILCHLIHAVFNIGTKTPWHEEANEYRYFRTMKEWEDILSNYRLQRVSDNGFLQDGDPSNNMLVLFQKQ